ncbi:MAG: hypothetical protein ACK5LC_06190 [Coprobacillaceae bacterium]
MTRFKIVCNTVIFEYKRFNLKLRDVGVAIITIAILLFALVSCDNNGRMEMLEALEDTCTFSTRNLHSLEDLLERSDLCSDKWFKDFKDYINRIEEQNELLDTMKSKRAKEIYPLQVNLLEALNDFYENQDDKTLKTLKDKVESYQGYHQGLCKGEGV